MSTARPHASVVADHVDSSSTLTSLTEAGEPGCDARLDVMDSRISTDASRSSGRTRRNWVLAGGIVVVVVALDQLTKLWAVAEVSDGPIDVVGDFVQLVLVRNAGSAFSLLSTAGITPLIALLAIGVAIFLVRLLARSDDVWLTVALALILGGALGNLSDRIFRSPGFLRGEVVDFVSVGSFPVFNVADAALDVGIVLLLVVSFRRPGKP